MNGDRKFETERRRKTRRLFRIYLFPVLAAGFGIILRIGWGFAPVKVLLNNLSDLVDLLITRETIQADYPALYDALSWVAAPIALFLLALLIVHTLNWMGLLDWLFPEPPAFVIVDLDAERLLPTEMIGGLLLPFTGREQELAELATLFDRSDRVAFRWRQIAAPSGVGKSRLALEWLAEAERRGWDMGVIDPKDSELLRNWSARKPTALVLDEAETQWSGELDIALQRLLAGASANRPVRVLVLGQFASYREQGAPADLREYEALPAMRLRLLEKPIISALVTEYGQPERAELIADESAGRPMAAALMLGIESAGSLAEAQYHWVYHLIPQLRSEGEKIDADLALGICLAALAGPVPIALAERLDPDFGSLPLKRFYSNDRSALLQHEIPDLRPHDLARALALQLFPYIPSARRAALLDLLLSEYPSRIEVFLNDAWSGLSDHGETPPSRLNPPAALIEIQSNYDTAFSTHILALKQTADAAMEKLSEISDSEAFRETSEQVIDACACRPFDSDFRHIEAGACVNATGALTKLREALPHAEVEFEQWSTRLISLVEDDNLGQLLVFKVAEAKAAVNATLFYSDGVAQGDLAASTRIEAWGDRLAALAEHSGVGGERAIAVEAAKAAINAILGYGKAGAEGDETAFVRLEAWGDRLSALSEDVELRRDPEIRISEAKAAINAINYYGKAGTRGHAKNS